MNELTTPAAAPSLAEATSLTPNQIIFNPAAMQTAMQVAEFMASGKTTTPRHLRGNKGDCLAVVLQAFRWGFDPTAVAASTFIGPNDQLAYEGKLIIAAINTSGRLKPGDSLDFEWFGPWEKILGKFKTVESTKKKDDEGNAKKFIVPDWDMRDEVGLGVRCSATLRGQSKPRVMEILMTQVRTRNSTLWVEDPKQQLGYLVGKRWGRLYTPEVILGVYTPDEIDDAPPTPKHMGAAEEVEQPSKSALTPAELAAWRAECEKGTAAARAYWMALHPEQRRKATDAQRQEMWGRAQAADKARTVDTSSPATGETERGAASEATSAPADAAPQDMAVEKADPATEKAPADVDPEFVAAMDKADAQAKDPK